MGLNIGNIDPQTIQKLLFGGPQAAMMPQDQQAPSQPSGDVGFQPRPPEGTLPFDPATLRGSIAATMPKEPAQVSPAEPNTTAMATPQQQQSPTASAPPAPTQNAPIPQAPQPFHHGTLAKIMLGVGEALGNPLATHIGERDRARQQEVDEYTRNQPYTQAQANRTAQAQDLGNLEKIAQTRRANVEADLAQQNLPMQEAAEKHYHELEDAWVKKVVPAAQFDTYAQTQLAAMPPAIARMVQPHLAAIKQLPQTGKDYKLNMQDDMPVSVESYGKTYQPDAKGGFGPDVSPQAVQDFQAAQKAHQAKRGEKLQDEKTVAGFAAERQGAGFAQAEKMQGVKSVNERANTALDADERLSRMERAYQKGLKGDQQAMLALLTDHIGMTMGLQKGARITKDILNEAQGSMPWLEKIGAKFDDRGYLSGAALGPEQMRQMLDLGYEARDRAYGSVRDAATMQGVPVPKGFEQVAGKRITGAKPAIEQGQHVPGGKAQGLQEGQTGTGSDGKKYVVRKGVWVSQ